MTNMLANQMRAELDAQANVMSYVENILEIDWLYNKQKKVLNDFYTEEQQFTECVLVIGMRSGKTLLASVMATFETFQLLNMAKPCSYYGLPKGSEIFIFNVARSEQQAKDTVFAHIKARIDGSEWFQNRDMVEHHNEFIFPVTDGKVIIRCGHSNSASLAGKTTKCAIIDEIARFKETGGNFSAQLVYDTLSRSVRTFNTPEHPYDGHLISISSPMYQDDFQMQLYRHGKKSSSTAVYTMKCPTWEFNPNITFESLEDEFLRNPESAWRDYGATPSAALEQYFKEHGKIKSSTRKDYVNPFSYDENDDLVFEWEPNPEMTYYFAGDPAVKNDCFGIALCHREGEIVINDWAWRLVPQKLAVDVKEIDAKEVREFALKLAGMCNLKAAAFDTWQYPETIQALREIIGDIRQHTVDKATYDAFKEGVYGGTYLIADYEVLYDEMTGLEMVRGKKVDHPRGGSKDVSDAVANALWLESQMTGFDDELAFAGVSF